jgi:NADH/NAD ratio-sensing transcriptional regulator Rex
MNKLEKLIDKLQKNYNKKELEIIIDFISDPVCKIIAERLISSGKKTNLNPTQTETQQQQEVEV